MIFCKFQHGVAYKSVAYKKRRVGLNKMAERHMLLTDFTLTFF